MEINREMACRNSKKEMKYLFLIFTVMIGSSLETDIFLPIFPDIVDYFKIENSLIQRVLTFNFIGIFVVAPFYGPLSDAFGRRKLLLIALSLFALGSGVTVYAESYQYLLLGRIIQGIGTGGCFSLGITIVFDIFHGIHAMRILNILDFLVLSLMTCAPILGGVLNNYFGFKANFAFILVLSLVSLALISLFLKDTRPHKQRKKLSMQTIFQDFKTVCSSFDFWQMALIVSLLFSGYIGYLSSTSVLYVSEFNLDRKLLPIFQATTLAGWFFASILLNLASKHLGNLALKKTAISILLIGLFLFTVVVIKYPKNYYALTGSMSLFSFGANWIVAVYQPIGMAVFPNITGTVSSILISFKLLFSAVVLGILEYFYSGTIFPIYWTVVFVVGACISVVMVYERLNSRKDKMNKCTTL